jgi:hypothetical protein
MFTSQDGDGDPQDTFRSDGYHVFPALLVYVQMLWLRRAAETPSGVAASPPDDRYLPTYPC